MRLFKAGDPQRLTKRIPVEKNDLFLRANIYNAAGILIATETLTSLEGALYSSTISLLPVGTYDVEYTLYKDVGFNNIYKAVIPTSEFIRVENLEAVTTAQLDTIIEQIDDNDAQIN